MAKIVITIEDTDDGKIDVNSTFDPVLPSLQTEEDFDKLTHAQFQAMLVIQAIVSQTGGYTVYDENGTSFEVENDD